MSADDRAWAWRQEVPAREKLWLLAFVEVFGEPSGWQELTEAKDSEIRNLAGMNKRDADYCVFVLAKTGVVETELDDAERKMVRLNRGVDTARAAPYSPVKADPGFVYVLKCGDYFKIGKSKDPTSRIKAIQTGTPYRVQQLAHIETLDMGTLERHLHALFADRRESGEWFRFGQDEVPQVMDALRVAGEIEYGVSRRPR